MITGILIAVIILLILLIIIQNLRIRSISNEIEEVYRGDFNGRLRVSVAGKSLKSLEVNFNRLLDECQKVVIQNKQYELDRKKMISNISHDLRTPLTSMLGYIEIIRDTEITENELKEYIDVIYNKGIILRNLIEEFFSLSKIESEDIKLCYKKVNITEITRQVVLSFIKDFESNSITPQLDIPDKDIFIKADEKAVSRIIQNLLSNSIKYGVDGKTVGLSLKEEPDSVSVEVWDRGKGIPKGELNNIFERLYTLEKSRNGKLRGSGIGLTIVKSLAEKHKAKIEVTSEPNERTSFKVIFQKDWKEKS